MELNNQNNCTNQSQGTLETRLHTRIHDDSCAKDQHSIQSAGPGSYQLMSPYHYGCDVNSIMENSINNVGMIFANGVGVPSGCNVDSTPIPGARRDPKCPNQLNLTEHQHVHGNHESGHGTILGNKINSESQLRNGITGYNCTNCTDNRISCSYGTDRIMMPLHPVIDSRIKSNQQKITSIEQLIGMDTSPLNQESSCDPNNCPV